MELPTRHQRPQYQQQGNLGSLVPGIVPKFCTLIFKFCTTLSVSQSVFLGDPSARVFEVFDSQSVFSIFGGMKCLLLLCIILSRKADGNVC